MLILMGQLEKDLGLSTQNCEIKEKRWGLCVSHSLVGAEAGMERELWLMRSAAPAGSCPSVCAGQRCHTSAEGVGAFSVV